MQLVQYQAGTKRKCYRCGIEKLLIDFYVNKTKKFGRGFTCKECSRAFDKIRDKNPIRKQQKVDSAARAKKKYPYKVKSRKKSYKLLVSGKIEKKPCLICGSEVVDMHHEDYTKHDEVIFLCRLHHSDYHKGRISITD